jgi:glycosyltransferase involved in cell wall biosynthesis
MTLLSIVIPCFNRHDLLTACLGSIALDDRNLVEVVLVDDGSEPPLEAAAREFLESTDLVMRQENRGRSAALRVGILAASGDYLLIMDSDDEFIPGALNRIVEEVAGLTPDIAGIAYECVDFDTGAPIARLPPNLVTPLLALRADHLVKGDLKEVVRTPLVKGALYPDPGQERRVPTSYIWAGVSGVGCVKTRALPVVRHRYLDGGMTRSIAKLKKQNPFWLARTYLRIATAPVSAYHSRMYRLMHGVKTLSVRGARLQNNDITLLRKSLGLPAYVLASIGGFLLRMGGS